MSQEQDIFSIWAKPPCQYRSAPFWSWNSKLDPKRLTDAIESMHQAGMGGFFMHSRYGLKTAYLSEEWFACISACIEKARELGMKAYLYDEDRWPSGAAGGLVTRDHPNFRSHCLQASPPADTLKDSEHVAAFELEVTPAGQMKSYRPRVPGEAANPASQQVSYDVFIAPPSGWYNDGAYLDTLNPEAVAEFIHVTHRAYADRYGKDFGGLVPAIFFDEPNYGGVHFPPPPAKPHVPWTPQLPREFKRRRGYDLREHLPELFATPTDFSKVRHDYYRTITELFVENFTRQIGQWCDKNGIALTGHMLEENTLSRQTRHVGACMPHYEHMQWPGIDILCDQDEELATAKQTTSVADQLAKPRVLSELYGCTGWDWPLEGHKFVGDWQYALGVNFRCPHLTHYSLAGGAKHDYPASISSHSPWWPYYNVVEDYFARLSFMLTQGVPVRDVLVIHPIESAWGLHGPGATDKGSPLLDMEESLERLIRTLSGEHWDWDFGDESTLPLHAKVAAKTLKVGQMTYQLVIVPACATLRSTTVALLAKFLAAGGKVLLVEGPPSHVDAQPADAAKDLHGAAECEDKAPAIAAAVAQLLPRRVSVAEAGREQSCVWAMLRKVKNGQVLFIQSHDRKAAHKVRLTVQGRRPAVLWDPLTGRQTRLAAQEADGRVELDLLLPPTGSAVVSLGLAVPDAHPIAKDLALVESRPLAGPYDIRLAEPNTFPLDYCQYRIGDQPVSKSVPSLAADIAIRKAFGLGPRVGWAHQPWYLYTTGVVDLAPRGRCQTRRTFHVTHLPAKCLLALEQPENFTITVNGKPAAADDAPTAWWVDRDIKTIDITRLLQTGDNEVMLDFDYRPDMELEDMYLVGDFGVARKPAGAPGVAAVAGVSPAVVPAATQEAAKDPTKPAQSPQGGRPGQYTLVAPPAKLTNGSWVGQGLDFYGGAVQYKLRIAKPAASRRLRLSLPNVACTAAAIHVGGRTFPLPWAPFEADITDALAEGENEVIVEVVGGRHNILGPLHVPWGKWTGPGEFEPNHPQWTHEYLLNHHGLMSPVLIETLE